MNRFSSVYLSILYINYFIIKYKFRYQVERRSNRVGIYSVPGLGSEWKAKITSTSLEKSSGICGQ